MRRKKDRIENLNQETDFEFAHPGQIGDETDLKEVYGRVANSTYVNVREEPDRGSPSLGLLQRGAPVKILKELGEHYKIEPISSSIGIGYISRDFCEVI